MQEERRMILRMLEEGKITVEEAEALLNALGDTRPSAEEEPREDPWAHLEKMGEDFASRVELAAERFSRSLEHSIGEKLTKLPKLRVRFPFLGFEETQEFTQVVRGPVGAKEVLPVDLSNVNGPIKLQGWSEDCYQLTVVQRLKGKDRDLLRSRLYEADWEENSLKEEFQLAVPSFADRSVSVHLMVPEDRTYAVVLKSQNGSLRIENLRCTTLDLETINGSTELRSVKAERLRGRGGNGSCEMEGVEADSITHELGNGSYRVSLAAASVDLATTNGTVNLRIADVNGESTYRLRTTNGSVKVSLPTRADLGVSLDLQASVGRVTADLGSLQITQLERQGGGAVLKARSADFSTSGNKLQLEASCVSGSITVSDGNSWAES